MRVLCTVGGSGPSTGAQICVSLYSARRSRPGCATLGFDLLHRHHWPNARPAVEAVDFNSIAMAALAADTFVRRDSAADGWCRRLDIDVELQDPARWLPLRAQFGQVLQFLTGDQWTFEFRAGPGPSIQPGRVEAVPPATGVALFSGGMDSSSALAVRMRSGENHALASYAYPRDGRIQDRIVAACGFIGRRLSVNLDPVFTGQNETSMRARSFAFFALAAMVASTMPQWRAGGIVDIVVPENGLIALNPPLTPRRVGALSTRTTHPYFLDALQAIFDAVGMRVRLVNPFELFTKAEVLRQGMDSGMQLATAWSTVSCGKWKRRGRQCGKCVPCIIRRSRSTRLASPTGLPTNTQRFETYWETPLYRMISCR